MAVVNALCVCTLYYETILIYCITFPGNSVAVVLHINNTFLICLTSFCRNDPFLLPLKICLVSVHQFLQTNDFFSGNTNTTGA
jgi:hypothetical protein